MKRAYFAFACLLSATTFCAAQSAPESPETKNDPAAQTPAATPQKPAGAPSTAQAPKSQESKPGNDSPGTKDKAKGSATSNDRLFYALPNFLTLENARQVPPMTATQKFKAMVRTSFDPVQIPWYGFLAGISQAENSESGYGQGAAGYSKRYGAYAADGTIENFMVGAVLPSVFRQDPRFFQSSQGGFWTRTGYALSRIVVTRNDSGRNAFNISEIAGSGIASAISTYSYHPSEDRTLGNTASVWGSQVGYDTITYVLKEFWPDIRRKLQKKHQAS